MRKDGRIFIGHGGSLVWMQLKEFLKETLGLQADEFNRESPVGRTTVARLQEMLDAASMAFLIMTAEDEHADNTVHARENVIHEIGLFQGKLGFEKAIVLLEDGCTEFSNIRGLTVIPFPKGEIWPHQKRFAEYWPVRASDHPPVPEFQHGRRDDHVIEPSA